MNELLLLVSSLSHDNLSRLSIDILYEIVKETQVMFMSNGVCVKGNVPMNKVHLKALTESLLRDGISNNSWKLLRELLISEGMFYLFRHRVDYLDGNVYMVSSSLNNDFTILM